MVQNATLMGANAVLSMRFDSSEIGKSMSEIVAYGTAVVVVPDSSASGTTASSSGGGLPPEGYSRDWTASTASGRPCFDGADRIGLAEEGLPS